MHQATLKTLVMLVSLFFSVTAYGSGFTIPYQSGWLGPQLNAHFGHEEVQYSIGLEASYWRQLSDNSESALVEMTQLSVDVGIEYNLTRETWAHYAELQTGILFMGTSVGIVHDGEHGIGWQWSSWLNWIAGGMVRFRKFKENPAGNEWSLGAYAKAPYLFEDDFFNGQW